VKILYSEGKKYLLDRFSFDVNNRIMSR